MTQAAAAGTQWRDGDTQPIPVVSGAAQPAVSGSGRHAAPPPRRSLGVRLAREVGIVAAIALLALILVRLVVGGVAYVPDDGMSPTLVAGQRVLVTAFPLTGGVGRGDVVVIDDVADWVPGPASDPSPGQDLMVSLGLAKPPAGSYVVARVIGMPGDRVSCCDDAGRILVNGQPLDESYLAGPTDQIDFDIRVPDGRIFVLGDDRLVANDSRSHLGAMDGTVSLEDVTGRVLVSLWPFGAVDGS